MNAFIILHCFRAIMVSLYRFCFPFPVLLTLLLLLFSTFFLAFLHTNHSLLACTTSSVTSYAPSLCGALVISKYSLKWSNFQMDLLGFWGFDTCKGHPKQVRQYWALLMESFWMHGHGFMEKQGHEMECSRVLFQLPGEKYPLLA